MAQALTVLEQAYCDFANGAARGTTSRLDTRVELDGKGRFFTFASMEGTVPGGSWMALRFNASHEAFSTVNGLSKKTRLSSAPGERCLGLILLISMKDGQPQAVLHDGYLSALRVGATSALAAKHLARADAKIVGIIGCGDQARAQLLGLMDVRALRRVRVYARNMERRAAFCDEMSTRLGIVVEPAESAREAIQGADLVVLATNSLDPVISTGWLSDGVHISAIVPGEVDSEIYQRSHVTIVNSKVRFGNEVGYLTHSERDWSRYPDLAELVTGRCRGRTDRKQITFFMNNAGLGFQFAACAARVYETARSRGLGHAIPTDWLMQPLHSFEPSRAERNASEVQVR